jgi:hypothetical protein
VITIGVLTPHATPGPKGRASGDLGRIISTRVARVVDGDPPTAATSWRTLTGRAVFDQAADALLKHSIDAVA